MKHKNKTIVRFPSRSLYIFCLCLSLPVTKLIRKAGVVFFTKYTNCNRQMLTCRCGCIVDKKSKLWSANVNMPSQLLPNHVTVSQLIGHIHSQSLCFFSFYVGIAMYCLDVMKDSLMTTKFLPSENVEAEYGIIGSKCVRAIWIVIENVFQDRMHLKFSNFISEDDKINTTAIKKALTAEVMLFFAEKLREQHLKVPICLERAHKSRVEGGGWFIWQSRIKSSAWFVKGAQACQKVTERQTKH